MIAAGQTKNDRKSYSQGYARLWCLFSLLACAFILTACGFTLRGYGSSAQQLPFQTIYINYPEQSGFGVLLRRHLRGSGNVTIARDPKMAQVKLTGLSENRRKEVLSLNRHGRAREYSLLYDLRFQVLDNQNQVLVPSTQISLKRTLTYDEAEALSKEAEEKMLYDDMQSDTVQQIIRRLAALPQQPELPQPSQEEQATE